MDDVLADIRRRRRHRAIKFQSATWSDSERQQPSPSVKRRRQERS
jgi:hypothetical protein